MAWLIGLDDTLKPREGALLRVVENKDIPHFKILVGYFSNSQKYSTEWIMHLIKEQNAGLNVGKWKIFTTTKKGHMRVLKTAIL